jgi:hypothetical protein
VFCLNSSLIVQSALLLNDQSHSRQRSGLKSLGLNCKPLSVACDTGVEWDGRVKEIVRKGMEIDWNSRQ